MMKKTLFLLIFSAAVLAVAAPEKTAPAAPAAVPAVPSIPVPTALKLDLPEIVYAAPGIECNIYFENVVDTAVYKNYAYEVRCNRGTQGEHRWFWTPDEADAGKSFDLELRLFNDWGMVLSGKCKVVVAAKAARPDRKITLALLADSGIGCRYPEHLFKVMRERGFLQYTPVGSHNGQGKGPESGEVMHDGYGGYAWGSFLSRWYYSEEELPDAQTEAEAAQMRALGISKIPKSRAYLLRSPLLRLENGKPVLDIPGWLKKINQGNAPDYIVIELGGNDIFSARPEQLETRVAAVMENARKLLGELRKVAPNAVIGVGTCMFGCGQDGFGVNYKCFQSRYQYRRNAHCYNRALTALVASLQDARISIMPLHQALDPENSFMTSSEKANARSSKKVVRFHNALHPTLEGGQQLGDAVANWLIYQEGK